MTATIIGGGQVTLSLNSSQAALAQAALAAAAAGYSQGAVLTSLTSPPIAGDFNVYNIQNTTHDHDHDDDHAHTDTLKVGGQAMVLTGKDDAIIVGHSGQELLIGNAGNDTINAAGGSGTVITGAGDNVIDMNKQGQVGGSLTIDTGKGSDTINMWGGAATVSAEHGGKVEVNVLAGANTVTGDARIDLKAGAQLVTSGNDTISFGSGADTIVDVGKATVTAGHGGKVTVSAGSGANSVAAGSGHSTLLGGSGADTFRGGDGVSSMVGGSSANVFIGGEGKDTMVANLGAASNLFSFDTKQAGGTHTIENFVSGQDHLKLVGYSTAEALHHAHAVGGNTVIDFGDGTSITLVGYNHLTATDITH
jgi:Ca2+-binding RTX toxin-like protein